MTNKPKVVIGVSVKYTLGPVYTVHTEYLYANTIFDRLI